MLYRLAGAAAILAGVLRAIDTFAFRFLASGDSEQLFLVTDIVLLFALIGLYAHHSRAIGWAGLVGFATAIVGIALTRSAAGIIDAYVIGAAIVAVGVAVLGVTILVFRSSSRIGPVLWIAALIVGILSWWIESDWLFEVAGVAFGLGFIAAGVQLFRRPAAA
jgi:hypothetical protein